VVAWWLAEARALRRAGRGYDGRDLLLEALTRFPGDPEVLAFTAAESESIRDLSLAKRCWASVVDDPDHGANATLRLAAILEREGRLDEAVAALRIRFDAPSAPAEALAALGRLAYKRGAWDEAASAWELLRVARPQAVEAWTGGIEALLEGGRAEAALELAEAALALHPDEPRLPQLSFRAAPAAGRLLERLDTHGVEASAAVETAPPPALPGRHYIPPHAGASYFTVLANLHDVLRPRSYLEIGVPRGRSLKLARAPSIGVDPGFRLLEDMLGRKPALHLKQMMSDDFFALHDPAAMLGVPGLDLAFLDGMHLCEFLLRDFMNAERFMLPEGIIVLHDCMPLDIAMTRRSQRQAPPIAAQYPGAMWAGDVWRVVPMLQKYRPDLRIQAVGAGPTGLLLVSRLDPRSEVLRSRYEEILPEMMALDLMEIGLSTYVESLSPLPAADFIGPKRLLRHFPAFS